VSHGASRAVSKVDQRRLVVALLNTVVRPNDVSRVDELAHHIHGSLAVVLYGLM